MGDFRAESSVRDSSMCSDGTGIDTCNFPSVGTPQANESLPTVLSASIDEAVMKLRLSADLLADIPLVAWAVILPLFVCVEMFAAVWMLRCCCRRANNDSAGMVDEASGLAEGQHLESNVLVVDCD